MMKIEFTCTSTNIQDIIAKVITDRKLVHLLMVSLISFVVSTCLLSYKTVRYGNIGFVAEAWVMVPHHHSRRSNKAPIIAQQTSSSSMKKYYRQSKVKRWYVHNNNDDVTPTEELSTSSSSPLLLRGTETQWCLR